MSPTGRGPLIVALAMASSGCGQTSDAPPMSRCEFRHLNHSTLEDGTLYICAEAVVGYDDPESCSAEAAARFAPLEEVTAAPGDGPCPDAGKRLGCTFTESHSTVWGYSGDGAQHVGGLCQTVSGGKIVLP